MSNYYEKYLKYKSKYINLKNQIGGNLADIPVDKWRYVIDATPRNQIGFASKYNIDIEKAGEKSIEYIGSTKRSTYIFLSKNNPKFLFMWYEDTKDESNIVTLLYRMKPSDFTDANLNDGTPTQLFNKGLTGQSKE
jgi:hypothetical protein